jgi:hypothetical protein
MFVYDPESGRRLRHQVYDGCTRLALCPLGKKLVSLPVTFGKVEEIRVETEEKKGFHSVALPGK